jgi:hypothetical protein
LHVIRVRVDVAVEVELDGNHGRAEGAYRGHLLYRHGKGVNLSLIVGECITLSGIVRLG